MFVEEQIIISKKDSEEINNYEHITKDYTDIKLKPNTLYHKKVKYNNPESHDKEIFISSSDSIIKIKKEKIKLEYLSSQFIRFTINTPITEGFYKVFIKIKNVTKNELEEVLKFMINVTNE